MKTKKKKEKNKEKKRWSVLHLLGLQQIALASVINGSLDASCKAGYEDGNAHLFVF